MTVALLTRLGLLQAELRTAGNRYMPFYIMFGEMSSSCHESIEDVKPALAAVRFFSIATVSAVAVGAYPPFL